MLNIRHYLGTGALLMFSSALTATELETLGPLEPRTEGPAVTINASAHPIRLPLGSLVGATFMGGKGEIINYDEAKGLYVTVVTPPQWGTPDFQMNQVPGYIFNRDYDEVDDPALVQELEAMSQLTLEPASGKKVGVMDLGEVTAYIAFAPTKTTVLLSSGDLPDLFTHLALDGFTWEELTEEILRGVGMPEQETRQGE